VGALYLGTFGIRQIADPTNSNLLKNYPSSWLSVISAAAPSWIKHLAADWVWLTFIQKDIAVLSADDMYAVAQTVRSLDPHFTAALRLLVMSLIFYKREFFLAHNLATEILTSAVNQADWRLYSYLLMVHQNNKLEVPMPSRYQLNTGCRIVTSELPEMPVYLKKLIA
jgi:hypothetical protein